MRLSIRTRIHTVTALLLPVICAALVVSAGIPSASAAERTKKRLKLGEFDPAHESVEMFEAMKEGQIEVKFIPKDSSEARVFITNKTKEPLNVKLPEAFAAVPAQVLAQFGGGGMGGMGGGGGGGGQGMGGGMGGGGGGGGFFNVAAEKVGNFKVQGICLEHGKPEPRPAMEYALIPVEQFTTDPAVHELCKLVGSGTLNQRAAQAAAWHLANEMSWQQLANKEIKRLDGRRYPYFSRQELMVAMQISNYATTMAEEKAPASPGEAVALSSELGTSEAKPIYKSPTRQPTKAER